MANQTVDISLANSSLGVIEYVDSEQGNVTNALGRVNAIFRVYNQAGDQIITATTSGVTAQRVLVIRQLTESIQSVTMTVTPQQMEASPLVEDSAQIDLRINDINRNGVPNVQLTLSATGGSLITPPVTDASGRTSTWWYNNRDFGEFTIYVRAGTLRDSATVNVTQVPPILGTLVLATSSREIEADGCITAANITATLKNQFGEAVRGDTIRFGAPRFGAVQPWAITDSLGVAIVNFCGMSIPNDQDPADSSLVVARYERWGIRDTVNIRIVPASGIGDINLSAANTTGIAGVDSIALNLNVFFANGARVNGYFAKFRVTQGGSFKYDSTRLVDGRPDSTNFYYLGNSLPQSPPEITVEVGGQFSEPLIVNVVPGRATYVNFVAAIPPIQINETAQAIVLVSDTFNNPVRAGATVNFTTTLGSITPFVETNETGIAEATLRPGNQAGVGIVTAKLVGGLDSTFTSATILAGFANSLTTTLNPSSMLVRGSGGQDWAQIEARAFDANGNPVPDGTWVYFTLEAGAPAGVNINNRGASDSAQTSNGLGTATLNAGSGVGPVSVRACVNLQAGGQQCSPATGSVVAGPPHEIQIGVNEIGVHGGGANWDLEISALVKDIVQNNVISGTAVFFEVTPPQLAQILSQSVVVGNQNSDGETHPGVAFTTLRFTSLVTNNIVTISARTSNGIIETMDFVLPVQAPTVEINAIPGSWHFQADGNPCRIELRAIVRDGHEVLINNQRVYYSTGRGRMYANPNGTGPTLSTALTGPDWGFLNGECSLYLVETVNNIFPDAVTPEIPGQVGVEVVGYQEATDSQVINFRRIP